MIEYRLALIRNSSQVAKLEGSGVGPEGDWANSYRGELVNLVLTKDESLAAQILLQDRSLKVLSDLDLKSEGSYILNQVGGSILLSIKALEIYLQVTLLSE
jgi:hypothetical protein